MSREVGLRACMLVLAWAHTLPALKHLRAWAESPSLDEAWKGFGATAAVVLYLLPIARVARALGTAWRRHRIVLSLAGWLLALMHFVPASDHLPKLAAAPSWGDAWRGVGSAFAMVWFVMPLPYQAMAVRMLGARPLRIARYRLGAPAPTPSTADR